MSKSVEELIEDLNDQDEFVVEATAGELEMMGEESVDALISALSHRKKNIRLNAAKILGCYVLSQIHQCFNLNFKG